MENSDIFLHYVRVCTHVYVICKGKVCREEQRWDPQTRPRTAVSLKCSNLGICHETHYCRLRIILSWYCALSPSCLPSGPHRVLFETLVYFGNSKGEIRKGLGQFPPTRTTRVERQGAPGGQTQSHRQQL